MSLLQIESISIPNLLLHRPSAMALLCLGGSLLGRGLLRGSLLRSGGLLRLGDAPALGLGEDSLGLLGLSNVRQRYKNATRQARTLAGAAAAFLGAAFLGAAFLGAALAAGAFFSAAAFLGAAFLAAGFLAVVSFLAAVAFLGAAFFSAAGFFSVAAAGFFLASLVPPEGPLGCSKTPFSTPDLRDLLKRASNMLSETVMLLLALTYFLRA